MFLYACRLYEKYRRRILPIALFSYDTIREEPDHFGWGFPFLEVMKFCYCTLELRKKNWRDFIEMTNPVAAALLSKMGYNRDERVKVRLEFLRMLVRLELDLARTQLLAVFFETYLKLNPQEEQLLLTEMRQIPEEAHVMELMTSWEKKGMMKGKKEGKKEGRNEGKKEVARNMLKMNMDMETIMKATGLSQREVELLKSSE
jgi:predicted transposase/invertase (TIGR01784 family)